MFSVTVDTILSANDMKKGDKLKEGDVLLILPFSGIEHAIVRGDTLQGIAQKYKVPLDEILISNDIDKSAKLSIGDRLMIPGGTLSGSSIAVTSSGVKSVVSSSQSSLKTVSGYFINPVPGARKSRGSSSTHRGVDLAAPSGTPIKASATGRVTFARAGYNGGFGNLVIIAHENGTETLYAHQSRIETSVGARVAQGDVIGYVGSTGRSTGPHLHFEVHGAKNPGNDNSWAR
jgi:murein DD-endopeptidase MepM/ murein hydrolase activator NlpD